MQKISLFHLFIFEIQSILESHDQTGYIHYWPYPPKKKKKNSSNFNFREFSKNSVKINDQII